MIAGVGLLVTPEPTMLTKVGGVVAVAHGADDFQTGWRQLWSEEEQKSLTQQGTQAGLEAVGVDEGTAETIATGTDIALSFIGSGSSVYKLFIKSSSYVKNTSRLFSSAAKISKNGASEVGRALQKHAGREGGVFSNIKYSGKTATDDGINGTRTIYDKVTGRG